MIVRAWNKTLFDIYFCQLVEFIWVYEDLMSHFPVWGGFGDWIYTLLAHLATPLYRKIVVSGQMFWQSVRIPPSRKKQIRLAFWGYPMKYIQYLEMIIRSSILAMERTSFKNQWKMWKVSTWLWMMNLFHDSLTSFSEIQWMSWESTDTPQCQSALK